MKKKMTLEERVSNFCNSLNGACKKIQDAAVQYACAVRDYPRDAPMRFREILPQMSNSGWDKLLKIGNGGANANIMWLSDVAANKIVRLPIEEQNKLLGEYNSKMKIRVVDRTTGTVVEKKVNSLKRKDLCVLIDDDNMKVRTLEAQKRFVEEDRRLNPKTVTALYRIEGDVLFVSRAGRITKTELIKILKEMSR